MKNSEIKFEKRTKIPSLFQNFGQNSLTFPICSKFLDFSLTGKSIPIFQVFQSMWEPCTYNLKMLHIYIFTTEWEHGFVPITIRVVRQCYLYLPVVLHHPVRWCLDPLHLL